MFIIVWRGWGLVALIPLLLVPLAALAGLMDGRPGLAFCVAGATLAGGGCACWVYGRRWNRPVTEQSLYFIPLQYWGLVYILFGVLTAAAGVAALLSPDTK